MLTTDFSGEMAISYEAVYLYDSATGKFVQELFVGPFPDDVTCAIRAPDTPLSAIIRSVHPGGIALATYCPGTSDAGYGDEVGLTQLPEGPHWESPSVRLAQSLPSTQPTQRELTESQRG